MQKQKKKQKKKHYPTDVTDSQWKLIAPLIPPAKSTLGKGGRPRSVDDRDIINAIFYLVRTGCQWRMLPKHFPPKSTVYEYFSSWKKDGTWKKIHDTLRDKVRKKAGKKRTTNSGNN